MTETKQGRASSRRRFLQTAALGGAVVAVPSVVRAQAPVRLKFQSTWPNKDIFHEFAADFVKRVNDMGKGRIELELLAAGAVVPAFQLIDAVTPAFLTAAMASRPTGTARTRPSLTVGTAPGFRLARRSVSRLGALRRWPAALRRTDQRRRQAQCGRHAYGPMPTQPLAGSRRTEHRPLICAGKVSHRRPCG